MRSGLACQPQREWPATAFTTTPATTSEPSERPAGELEPADLVDASGLLAVLRVEAQQPPFPPRDVCRTRLAKFIICFNEDAENLLAKEPHDEPTRRDKRSASRVHLGVLVDVEQLDRLHDLARARRLLGLADRAEGARGGTRAARPARRGAARPGGGGASRPAWRVDHHLRRPVLRLRDHLEEETHGQNRHEQPEAACLAGYRKAGNHEAAAEAGYHPAQAEVMAIRTSTNGGGHCTECGRSWFPHSEQMAARHACEHRGATHARRAVDTAGEQLHGLLVHTRDVQLRNPRASWPMRRRHRAAEITPPEQQGSAPPLRLARPAAWPERARLDRV